MENLRILIADDHNLVREGIAKILKDIKGVFVVGEAENGVLLVEKYLKLNPDLVIADISMPKMTGIEACKKIIESDPKAKILFLSMHVGEEFVFSAYKAGAKGLLNKDTTHDELELAIKTIVNDELYFSGGISREELMGIVRNFESDANRKVNGMLGGLLSEREIEILKLIAEGYNSEEIAEQLFISKRTVDNHRSRIMVRLNINSRPEFMRAAIRIAREN